MSDCSITNIKSSVNNCNKPSITQSVEGSCNTKQHHPITDNDPKLLQRTRSIGLGIVVPKQERKRKLSNAANAPTQPPPSSSPPLINVDSGTPQDTTHFSRRIIPLPSPSCALDQPRFAKHDIISPLPPSLSLSSSSSSSSSSTDSSFTPTIPPPPSMQEDCDDEYIPVISLSPSFPLHQRVPNLTELPMLGDIDDDHFMDHGLLSIPPLMAVGSPDIMVREPQSLLSPANQIYDETTLVGKTIWQFRINKLIGVGAFSKVYLATHTERPSEKSAIKMIRKIKMLKEPRIKSSIEREVAVLQFLHHPGIIQLEATMEIEQHLCLVLEYVDGGELFDFVQQKGMLDDATGHVDERLVKDLFFQLVTVVQWMHEQNVVHRDLKLENILLYRTTADNKLQLKITDFGLARVIDPQNPLLTTRCGSEEYAAPEIVQGIGYDGRQTDTWALGVILYTMLVGHLPFTPRDGSSLSQLFYQIIQGIIRWPKDQTISDHAKQTAEAFLHRQPSKRIALVDAFSSLPWLLSPPVSIGDTHQG